MKQEFNYSSESLGYAQIGSAQGNLPPGTFDGQSINSGDVIVKFTYYGDTNLDGNVNSTDLTTFTNGEQNQLTGWTNGDFNYDGTIGRGDSGYWDNTNSLLAELTPGTMTLAADASFPVSSLPTVTPPGAPISSWLANWGNGQTSTFLSTDSFEVPYVDMSGQYVVALTPLDANGNPEYYYPRINMTVTAIGPSNLSAATVSPNEIDLSWTGFSEPYATATNIYVSTDGTSFNYFDSVDGSTTSYHAKGLSPNTAYTFEVKASDANYKESSPSNAASAATQVDPWNVQANGSSGVLEGNTYQLNLSLSPIAGALAFDHWTVDWGDGSISSPDLSIYTTQNIAVSHTFASGTSAPVIQISAATAGGAISPLTVTAPPVSVNVTPLAPAYLHATMYSSTEVDLAWPATSAVATGYNILRSDSGGTFNLIQSVDATVTTYSDSSLSSSDSVQYEIQSTGLNGDVVSTSTSSSLATTPTGAPTFNTSAGAAGSYSVKLGWSYVGKDDSRFEIEMEDQTTGENYHTILSPDAVASSDAVSATVGSLYGGDTYSFRMRVDRIDGSFRLRKRWCGDRSRA